MPGRDRSASSSPRITLPGRRRTYAIAAGVTAAALSVAAVTVLATGHSGARHGTAGSPARLASSTCNGPAGAAYVADAGWDGFSAIDTANCKIIQTYNVGDTQVPNDPGDYNYSSTDEAVALRDGILYVADAGTSDVAVIDTTTLNPSNYNPAGKLINVGLFPQDLAVSPDGSQVWVADTGPQTSPSSPSDLAVISTATDTVTARLPLRGGPTQIAFSPSGARAYVTTADGLWVYNTATRQPVGLIRGLGEPRSVAVSPDGQTLYVTDTNDNAVSVISAATGKVTRTIGVGQLPWQIVVSADGKAVYVADADSNAVSVISTASGTVSRTITVPGDPDTLGLTPNGQQLWVGQNTAAKVTVLDTTSFATVGVINLGGSVAQSADGYEPTGITLTSTPTAGS
jgi:YVTN family beta-propeller protein